MSSSPASSPSEGGGAGGEEERGDGGDEEIVGGPSDRPPRRSGDPSSTRRRSADAVWPEHFVESVAVRVAVDAARSDGRLAAGPAMAAIFQVCSTWRAVSRSELLWEDATRGVWYRRWSLLPTWHEEFVRLHRTARNFRTRRSAHSHLLPAASPALSCRRLALSDRYLAAGFLDGSIRLFELPSGLHLTTYRTHPQRDRLGPFSQSISGLILLSDPSRLVFACQDGDLYVAPLDDPVSGSTRRAHVGNLMEDGTLVDFAGDSRWWVGLFAGLAGRSWHVWDAETEQLVYEGGSLTDPDSVLGWRMLTDLDGPTVGRVRTPEPGAMVACTSSRLQVVDLDDPGEVSNQVEFRRRAVVESVDACDGRVMVVDLRGLARVLRARTLAEVCRFSTVVRLEGHPQQRVQGMVGCMNWGYAVVCSVGSLRVWDASTGEYLYSFRERVGDVTVVAASDRYVAAWVNDTGLHLWDYGAL
ncbi:transcriptional regulator STERILE APETALA [Elaeis guineensis]|uniref:Transcriptional regulator STERILE APETALA n=1 Tax=Elaeis guineensis var. tenera TaxID=51953 RepID=A0A8N4EQZ1_ELAGV|nr:transcriptional regulator STERILE APETALA [Elaeis guineensis]